MEQQLDVIKLTGIEVQAKHGAHPGEKDHAQPFYIEAEITADLSKAQLTDKLEDTVDYWNLHGAIVKVVKETSYSTLERLAMDIFAIIFQDQRVQKAAVTIGKPRKLDGATAMIVISRSNPKFVKDVSNV